MPGTAKEGEGGIKRYLPFSTGPRQCIGQSLAHMMHNVGVAVLLCRFSFRLAPKVRNIRMDISCCAHSLVKDEVL